MITTSSVIDPFISLLLTMHFLKLHESISFYHFYKQNRWVLANNLNMEFKLFANNPSLWITSKLKSFLTSFITYSHVSEYHFNMFSCFSLTIIEIYFTFSRLFNLDNVITTGFVSLLELFNRQNAWNIFPQYNIV